MTDVAILIRHDCRRSDPCTRYRVDTKAGVTTTTVFAHDEDHESDFLRRVVVESRPTLLIRR